jgi:polyisoprenoid-binding protein YceI
MSTRARQPLPAGIWTIDQQRSEIGFAVKEMWGLRTVHGVFGAYGGTLELGPGKRGGKLTIDADSIKTGNNRRDRHLRSPAFFDVEQHRQIMFTTTAVTARHAGLTIAGELTIGSSRVPLEIPVSIERLADGELRLEGRTSVSRRAAGLAWNVLGMIRGDAIVYAKLTLKRAIS